MAVTSGVPTLTAAPDVTGLSEILHLTDELTSTDWHQFGDAEVEDLIVVIEQVKRRLTHVHAGIVAAAEAKNSWAANGARSIQTWLRDLTGGSRIAAARAVRLSRALRDELPESAHGLASGRMGREHGEILVREATKTATLREQLADPERGEAFLVGMAENLSADDFRKAVKHWAAMADPEAADRNWREETEKDEVFLTEVGESFYLNGRLSLVSGRALQTALTAQMGRKAEGEDLTLAERRAAALVSWAHSWLDSGDLTPGARIRPHLSVHVPFETLEALVAATRPAIPLGASNGEPPGGADEWRPGEDHVISSAIDYEILRGHPPATLDSGHALAPAALSRLACDSKLTRIVFGAESTIIDVGREERIFPANQTRAIIARDRHCQYPGCSEPPEFGEIHHSLWWWKHNGKTSTDQGILLCWHHHAYVHERHISISRRDGTWVFHAGDGSLITVRPRRERAGPGPRDPNR